MSKPIFTCTECDEALGTTPACEECLDYRIHLAEDIRDRLKEDGPGPTLRLVRS